ncbi:MAG: ribonuclease HII [Lachnospiraceae bacterium]|nr:ribonuclease HII [Lachnoclostridium sp.]MDD7521335.1 ribonuclease HII [Lachnoclostridium sp.]MDY2599035.1 ribonuclease HII [Lachnospiraceae bacterium]
MTDKSLLPEKEVLRLEAMMEFERKYSEYDYICGIDEVGRGPLAGPVVAAAVILPKDSYYKYLNDSKKVTEKRRNKLYDEITTEAVSYGIGLVSPDIIDDINILQATYVAMKKAIDALSIRPQMILVDAVHIPDIGIPQVGIVKGDAKSISIAAASIVAKVYRDRLMTEYDALYPEYKFAKNKGYGTKEHMQALHEIGMSPIHRKSFVHI